MRMIIATFLFFFSFASCLEATPIVTDRIESSTSVLSFASWLQDAKGDMGITKASEQSLANSYTPLTHGFPIIAKGAGWLRLDLTKTPPAQGILPKGDDTPLVLTIGALPPGRATIYYQDNINPVRTPGFWFATDLHPYEEKLLPEPPLSGSTIFVKFEETPGLWFTPYLTRDGNDNPFVLPPDLILPGVLLCGIIVCLLRALKDRFLWPIWASCMLALTLVQVLFPLPISTKPISLSFLPAILTPGICLIIYPHLARLMLKTKEHAPFQDIILSILPLFGVLISITPLIPGYGWITRLFPLWPLLLFLLLPACINALANKRAGALAFTGACLLPALGASWALSSLFAEEMHPLAVYGGIWGIAVSGLFLFLARVPNDQPSETTESSENHDEIISDSLGNITCDNEENSPVFEEKDLINKEIVLEEIPLSQNSSTSLGKEDSKDPLTIKEHVAILQLDDDEKSEELSLCQPPNKETETNTSIIPQPFDKSYENKTYGGAVALFGDDQSSANNTYESYPSSSLSKEGIVEEDNVNPYTNEVNELKGSSSLLETIGCAHGVPQEAEPQSFQQRNVTSGDVSHSFSSVLSAKEDLPPSDPLADNIMSEENEELEQPLEPLPKVISLDSDVFSDIEWEQQASQFRLSLPVGESYIFNLHAIVSDVHHAAMPLAEDKDILLSWFISPSLPSFLEGDAASLRQALSLLVQNAVQATENGAVQLFVRHDPAASLSEATQLQFTISDTGVAQRADSGFFHAWELAQRTGGSFSIEYSASGGTLITFSAKFSVPSKQALENYTKAVPVKKEDQQPLNNETPQDEPFPLTQQLLKTLDIEPESTPSQELEEIPGADKDPLLPRIVITEMTTSNKRLVTHYLLGIPYVGIESKSMNHALEIIQQIKPSLVIYDGDAPEDAIISSINIVSEKQKLSGLPLIPQLVLASHEAQASRMLSGGATRVLLKPFVQEDLVSLVEELLSFPKRQEVSLEKFAMASELNSSITQSPVSPIHDLANSEVPHIEVAGSKPHIQKTEQKTSGSPFHPNSLTIEESFTPNRSSRAHVAPLVESLQPEDIGTPIEGNRELKSEKSNEEQQGASLLSEPRLLSSPITQSGSSSTKQEERVPSHFLPEDIERIQLSQQKLAEKALTEPNNQENDGSTAVAVDDTLLQSFPQSTSPPSFKEQVQHQDHSPAVTGEGKSVSNLEKAGEVLFAPAITGNYPIPGMENEYLEVVMLPLLPGLLNTLDDALKDSIKAREEHQTIFVQEAVGRLAGKAEVFGLDRLAKIARCVERAAGADDFEAVDVLLDDLVTVTTRYIQSLKECYESFLNENH